MAAEAKKAPIAAPEEVPEVKALLEVEQELAEHIASQEAFYRKLVDLTTRRNALLPLADARVRELGVTCGPFVQIRSSQEVDVEKLYEELGDEAFKKCGGYTEQVTSYKLDKPRFLAFLKAEVIPKEVVEVCVSNKTQYKKVPPYELP